MYYAIHLRAPHDVNGNPRRVFLVYDAAGELVGAADEGYRGKAVLGRLVPEGATINVLAQISVPVSEYHDALGNAEKELEGRYPLPATPGARID